MDQPPRSFAEAKQNYETIKSDAEGRVVRWEYYIGETWHWYPDSDQALKRTPLPRLETPQGAYWALGFQKDDRLVVRKEINRRAVGTETFLSYTNNGAWGASFYNGDVQETFTLAFDHGRIVEVHSQSADEQIVYGYQWRDGKPVGKTTKFDDGSVFEDIVDEDWNVIEEWKIRPDGRRVRANPELPKGTTLKSLSKSLRELLPAAIRETLVKAAIAEPVYCICLAYDGENPGISMACVGIGLESERQKFLAKQPDCAADFLWNPAEFHYFDKAPVHLTSEHLIQLSDWFTQLAEAKDSIEPSQKLLLDVAADLANEDWSGVLHPTADFVVYAVDYHLSDLEKNIKKTVPSSLLKQFKKAGWL